ncbi:MAG: glycoside hydrolase family 2 TIM barrel-domain containing protein [Capsulimonadaceae bacterium]|nr:glycoside hydrolase family 2 TIM barrel-domain containing protein [Capsulimonadaceae bacterium]
MAIPRPEYPRPQFVRDEWLCLNGEWQFEIDPGDSGLERGLVARELANRIQVPFCPESPLSGIGNKDFMNAVWYRRVVDIPAGWAGKRVLLHFQAVDYDATIWIDGVEAARHRGGFTPISVDVSSFWTPGKPVVIVVRARDTKEGPKPFGKQSQQYGSHGCHYTRTTGIWQTVWLEATGVVALKRPRITPDLAAGAFRLELPLTGNVDGAFVRVVLKDAKGVVADSSVRADLDLSPRLDLFIPEDRRRPWSIADPHLYDLELTLTGADGKVIDRATSYAGLRGVSIHGKKIKINGQSVFQRLVLDQGYYPDGIMTAPSDAALISDIKLSMEAGFNGARLHQKVFEERFLYHADRLGYIVWGEFADWGAGGHGSGNDHQQHAITYAAQWLEELERDYSHPSIVGWCALNETHQPLHDRITNLDDATRALFLAAKAMDTTRPVLDTSGYAHRVPEADVYDSHDYIGESDFEKGIERFALGHAHMADDKPFINGDRNMSVPYRGQPYFVSEFGGFKWVVDAALEPEAAAADRSRSWGYGSNPTSLEDFYRRFEAVCKVLLDNPYMFGYCYTQLTDIDLEENGIYCFDRTAKFDSARLSAIQKRIAAIEEA